MEEERIQKSIHSYETPQIVPIAFLFDVDGVITNPVEKKVIEPELFDELAKLLSNGIPVALVTGRALPWVVEHVVTPLTNLIENKSIFDRFFVSGEFGASQIRWKNGEIYHLVDNTIALPEGLVHELKEAAKPYTDTQHIDPDKETMVSIEMNDGLMVEQFKPEQLKLAKALEAPLKRYNSEGKFEIHIDRIATNIKNKTTNKRYAAQQVNEWLLGIGLQPQQYFAFGDSSSDREMADELHAEGKSITFIFVGNEEELGTRGEGYKTVITQKHCDEGTLEFLKSLSL